MLVETHYKKNDIVLCNKTTRGKHFIEKAKPGEHYIVTSYFVNNFGTCKLFLVDSKGDQFFTTDNCVSIAVDAKTFKYKNDESVTEEQKKLIEIFEKGKIAWMDKTYVPVFASHLYDYSGHPVLTSKDNGAVLFKKLTGGEKIWINKDMVHENDMKLFLSSSLAPDPGKKGEISETISFRVPSWFAEKKGLIG